MPEEPRGIIGLFVWKKRNQNKGRGYTKKTKKEEKKMNIERKLEEKKVKKYNDGLEKK